MSDARRADQAASSRGREGGLACGLCKAVCCGVTQGVLPRSSCLGKEPGWPSSPVSMRGWSSPQGSPQPFPFQATSCELPEGGRMGFAQFIRGKQTGKDQKALQRLPLNTSLWELPHPAPLRQSVSSQPESTEIMQAISVKSRETVSLRGQ